MDPLSDHPTEAHEAAGNAIERPDDPTPPAAPGSDRILHQPAGIRPPLSYSQQRLWFMDQLEPGSIDYNRTFALRLSGPLDLDSLRHSLNEIVRRHEVLRTSFPAIEGRPFQQVNPPHPLDIPLLDLSGLPGPDRRSEAARLARQVASRPFDLIHDLLIRPGLIRLDQEQHVLHLTTHHIAFDGFSESIFLRELAALYTAARAGADPQLAEPVIQYGDYAAWERQRAQGGALNEDLAYWRKALSDLSPRPGLPTLEGESPAVDGAVGQERLELPGPLSEAVRGVCRREGVTPFMMFASVFVLLLHRLSDSDDMVIGFPVAGRTRLEVENLIGMFINTLPLRADLAGYPTFEELLRQVRRVIVEALGHQGVPFERLVEEIQPERSLAHPPIFDFMINSHVFHQAELNFGDLDVEEFPLPELSTAYPLTFYIYAEDNRYRLKISYQTGKFSAERIRSLLGQMGFLLEQVVGDPHRPVGEYSLVDPSSRSLIPDPAAKIQETEYPNVMSMVAEWVERDPSAVAVTERGRSNSYAELWGASAGAAEALTEGGLQQGQVVAIVGRRSFELVAGILGVLMAGGVTLLIDPDWSRTQIEVMLDRGQAKHLLRLDGLTSESSWIEAVPGLVLHDLGAGLSGGDRPGRSPAPERPLMAPSDPAYVFFTSGTTGEPEPVLGCHKGLSHFLKWQRETFGVGPGDRCSLLTGLSFDPILRDVFLPLTSGGVVCIPDPGLSPASERILSWIDRERITILHGVPSLVRSWIPRRPTRASLRSLRWIFLAGEPLGDDLVRSFRQAFPSAGRIVNLYGPTETTFVKCFYIVPANPSPGIQPLGFSLPQTQVLILNSNEALGGIGEPGEIVIRTPYRTLGYLLPDSPRTSSFIPNPYADDPADVLYRTGDRGYYRSDGTVGFLGRIDRQVKILGTRIEPDGVAAVLSRQPGVLACEVIAVKDERGFVRLTAYVEAKDSTVTAQELRDGVGRELPSAMVPTGFAFLEKLPLTSNGKVDRDALRALAVTGVTAPTGIVPPRNQLERRLVRIWEDVLDARPIGVLDDFFDKGGHSLLAVRMFVEVERATKKRLPVRAIFEAPTIERLAALIQSDRWTAPESQLVPIQPKGTKLPIFWVHAAGGHVLSYRRLARYLGPEQPVYALQGLNLEEHRLTEVSVEGMAARYVVDLQKVQPAGPYFVGGLSFGGLVAWEMAQRLRAQGHDVGLLILLDTRGPGFPRPSLFHRLALELRQRIEFHTGNLSVLDSDEKLSYILERAQMLVSRVAQGAYAAGEAIWNTVSNPMPLAVRRAYRHDIKARARYTPKPYAGPIAFFRAQAQPGGRAYPLMGWEGIAQGRMDIYEVPGAHVSIMAEPHLSVLAAKLNECLEIAQRSAADAHSEEPV